jgi:hypothetical protein
MNLLVGKLLLKVIDLICQVYLTSKLLLSYYKFHFAHFKINLPSSDAKESVQYYHQLFHTSSKFSFLLFLGLCLNDKAIV